VTLNDATGVAKEAVKGLSGSPALLLIMLLNVAMLVGVGYVAKAQQEERRELRADDALMFKVITDMCAHAK
jgi:hypothetical protein